MLADPEDEAANRWARMQIERQTPVRLSPFQHPLVWTSDPFPNSAMVPAEALQRLVAEING